MLMRNNQVAVILSSKDTHANQLFKIPTNNNSVGVIKYINKEFTELSAGQRVAFLNKYDKLYINGEELLIMDESNIIATLEK